MPVICWYTGIQPPLFFYYEIMKIFLDTADTQQIQDGYNTGLIDGITTNPTLIMKSGRDPEIHDPDEVFALLCYRGINYAKWCNIKIIFQ